MMLHNSVIESRGFRLLEQAEIEIISGGDGEIIVTAPTPEWNRDLNSYAVLANDGGYVTYDYQGVGFFGLWGGEYVVTGGGTYEINGGGWEVGTGGISYTHPSYTFSPD